jgi:hypothetical protein
MSSVASNLKAIYRQGRDKSIHVLVADVKDKYAKHLESGRDQYNYNIVWKQEGYFMSPFHVIVNAGSETSEPNIYTDRVSEGEIKVFIHEVARALESEGIYSNYSSCEYEKTPSNPGMYHMVINMRLTQTQPIVETNTKQEYATYKTWSNPDMWKEDSNESFNNISKGD